jgi:predicted anti-sigma-YlaC factor YlaD
VKFCGWIEKRVIDFLENGLSDVERKRLLSHIAQCPDCKREFQKYERLYRVMSEDEVVVPPAGAFEEIWDNIRQETTRSRRLALRRMSRILVTALAAAAILLVVLWPRNETVEFGVPVAKLMEDEDIASLAVAAIVDEEMADELAAIEYYLLPETEQAIEELTADEKNDFINSLHQRYPTGT